MSVLRLRPLPRLPLRILPALATTPRCFLRPYCLPPHTLLDMPALSPTMTQGNIAKWNVKVGDEVGPGMVYAEVETDKATVDFEAVDDGIVAKILVAEGTSDIAVGTPVAVLVEDAADIPKFANYSPAAAANAAPTPAPAPAAAAAPAAPAAAPAAPAAPAALAAPVMSSGGHAIASPLAKRLAAEKGLDLSTVSGTGPGGRVLASDVMTAEAAPAKTAAAAAPPAAGVLFEDLPISQMRKVIASRLTSSKQEVPHYYLSMEIQMDELMKMRGTINTALETKISVNDFIIKACALAMKDVPAINSQWHGDFIRQFHTVDISVAVATPTGLITPIVKDADTRGIKSISDSVKELAGRAKDNKLKPEEFTGGGFTISNLGMFGVTQFTAIINQPQSCILAVGGANQKLVPADTPQGFKTITTMMVTMSPDHRTVDGAVGAQFLQAFKKYMESPVTMLV